MIGTVNINKFQWSQLFNDSKGKTSASLVCGVLIVFSSCGGFLTAGISMSIMNIFNIAHNTEDNTFFQMLVMQSIAFATIGATLLGIHRLSKDKEIAEEVQPIQ